MSPHGDYAPLTDEPNDAEQHAFPPRTRSARSARSTRLPAQRPPLWIPDPFRRDGDYDDREGTDSGEDTACESDNEATTSSGEDKGAVRRDARMADKSEAIADDDDDEWDFTLAGLKRDRARRRRRLLVLSPALLVLVLFFILALANVFGPSSGQHRFYGAAASKRRLTLDDVLNGTLTPQSRRLAWVALPGKGGSLTDGLYAERGANGSVILHDFFRNSTRTLIAGEQLRAVWRHSTLANFYLHRISPENTGAAGSATPPLVEPHSPPRTSLGLFSPTSHHVAYVHANDLFVLPAESIDADPRGTGWQHAAIRVTSDGDATTMSGRPSWVYEEEVFSSDSTLWWSPTSSHLAFLSSDDKDVPLYEYPVYNWSPAGPAAEEELDGWEYPKEVGVRYPKPGYANPTIKIRVFSLAHYQALPASTSTQNRIASSLVTLRLSSPFDPDLEGEVVTEVAWIGADELLVRMTDRSARVERVGRFDLASFDWSKLERDGEGQRVLVGEVVRETDWWRRDGGWAEATQTIVNLASSESGSPARAPHPPGYLDLVPDRAGYVHVAFYSPSTASEPVFLTEGAWEVAGGIDRVDLERGLIYFTAARPTIERHVYSIPLPRGAAELEAIRSGKQALAEPALLPGQSTGSLSRTPDGPVGGSFKVQFSALSSIYQLDYEGPGVPQQTLHQVKDPETPVRLTDNAELRHLDSTYMHANIIHSTEALADDGTGTGQVEVDVMEIRPPMMDESGRTKYPVLFQVYGGPNSQIITTKFQRDFHHYLATSLDYIVVRVDPRGTGFRGRKFRSTVRGRLGEIERQDVIEVARRWAHKAYVDEKRIGVWGWSYGGFLTSKIIEANSSVFSLGMAVAPVTDWRLYDSLYTERYMGLPEENHGGYSNSSVRETDGFRHADFALAHGSGDDNVHFQNTALLLDSFTLAGIRRFRFRMFTDSDHSIRTRNAYGELLRWLEGFLLERFGQGGRTKGRWKMRKDPSGARPAFGPGEHDFGRE
ncbi:Dipeptidyl peptidase 4 [Rhodotorula sphaerocarpa]